MADLRVRVRSWVRASDNDIRSGLLGFISAEYGDLVLDSITLRRTATGRFALSFPAKTGQDGRKHAYVRPRDDQARVAIEREILGQLGQHEDVRAEAADG